MPSISMLVNIEIHRYHAGTMAKRSTDPDIQLLAALADPTRMEILRELAGSPEVCACDLTTCCDVSPADRLAPPQGAPRRGRRALRAAREPGLLLDLAEPQRAACRHRPDARAGRPDPVGDAAETGFVGILEEGGRAPRLRVSSSRRRRARRPGQVSPGGPPAAGASAARRRPPAVRDRPGRFGRWRPS